MAHSLDYRLVSPFIGSQPISETSTTKKHPLGTIVKAVDTNYGEGEFIYLKGVANTTASAMAVFDVKAGTTTLTTAATTGQVGVAMSANVANQYGWYQIKGEAVVLAAANVVADKTISGLTGTPGTCTPGVDGVSYIAGATAKTATGTPTAGYAQIQIAYPYQNALTVDVA
jgi:hypothetical protein